MSGVAPLPLHPLSAFLAPWFAAGVPGLDRLNAAARERAVVSGSGLPLRFVEPPADGEGYEARIFRNGDVATRADNRHDLFNALTWLEFPRAKAALNRRHHAELYAGAAAGRRGPVRDALTQFDECGVVVAGTAPDLWRALCAHRWREVFVLRRAELLRTTRFLVFGHASHDLLGAPFAGLCGKALFVEVDAAWLDSPGPAARAAIDGRLAARFEAGETSPRDWQPLPLLGIPGATADNEVPAYYEDARQFRPPRTIRAGSPPGNR